MQTLIYFILVPMVYIAFGVFLIGTLVRLVKILRTPKNPATLQIYPPKKPGWFWALSDTFLFPTIRRHKPVLWVFLVAFHVALILLLIGHLELIWELSIFQIIPHEIFLGNGFVGLVLVLAILYFFSRRLLSPVKELSIPEDYFLLILLFLVVLFGSQMDWARSWYEYGEMAPEDYSTYLYSLLVFQPELPEAVTDSGHSFMLIIHIFLANLFLIYLPFSSIMHAFFSLPANKLRRG